MKMSQPLRVDYPEGFVSFITRRTINSRLYFANNSKLENRILACFGKYATKYGVKVYSLAICGSHDHATVEFKPKTKSNFFRDLGARTAEAIRMYVPTFEGGPIFERRVSEQAVPEADIADRFWYCALQPVEHGLCKRLRDYKGYNSFWDAISGRAKRVSFVNWSKFRAAKKRNPDTDIQSHTETYFIEFERLPGYEHLSQDEYSKLMLAELEAREKEIVELKEAEGYVYPSPTAISSAKATDKAKHPKKSKRYDKRPLVLTKCLQMKRWFLDWYFSVVLKYKSASQKYLRGDVSAQFPPGTCKPPGPLM